MYLFLEEPGDTCILKEKKRKKEKKKRKKERKKDDMKALP